jgi:membrane associated rhomboid family serine protease
MNTLVMIGCIIWIISGVLALCCVYYSIIKEWYLAFNEDIRNTEYKRSLVLLQNAAPFIILGGAMSLIMLPFAWKSIKDSKSFCLYFRIPKNNKVQ